MSRLVALARLLAFAACVLATRADAQESVHALDATRLSFEEYMARVSDQNLQAMAARATLPIAAGLANAARAFPNPSLTVGLQQLDVSGQGAPTASYAGIGLPIELGGKRRHRIAVATAGLSLAQADLEGTLRRIRVEAALAYADALEAQLVLALRRRSLEGFERLVEVNRHRFEHGDIDETTYLQSRVEAQRYRADLTSAEGEAQAADVTLAIFASADERALVAIEPIGDLEVPPRSFDEATLLAHAAEQRPELAARLRSVERARMQLGLARSLRIVDLQLTFGWTHNRSTNEAQFRQNSNDTVGLLLSMPLPFSNVYRGTLDAARGAVVQEELLLDAQRLSVGIEVRRALTLYRAAVSRLAIYDEGLREGADQVLERVLYQYQRGAATLLEVINAQRTANEVHVGHIAAHADHLRALIELEAAVGTWDVEL